MGGRPRSAPAAVLAVLFAAVGLGVAAAPPSRAAVTSVRASACGYYVNVGLFGGPQMLRGCGQAADGPAAGVSPFVTLPAGGSATPITATDPDGATAQYGPARIFAGLWPADVASAPPSGPITASTQGTTGAAGAVTSSVDIVLRDPPNAVSPGGFGPGPVEGDELHSTCSASAAGVTGSARFVKGLLSTSTDAGGSPVDQEAIPDNPPPNYTRHGVITNVGDVFSVVFNEQIRNADGSLTVNAFHMYLFGPVAVGESVGGQVTCGVTPGSGPTSETRPPTCGVRVVALVAPDDPTPRVPREELIGVFDAGGLQSISNISVTNGTVHVPPNGPGYLNFNPGQKGPLPVTATRTDAAEAANLPLSWSFDATDAAGNTRRCDGVGSPAVDPTPTTTTTSSTLPVPSNGGGATTSTTATTVATGTGATTTSSVVAASTMTTQQGATTTTTTTAMGSATTTVATATNTTLPTTATLSGALARTGLGFGVLVMLASLGVAAGAILVPWHRRQASAAAAVAPGATPGSPENWGLDDIAKALIGGVAALATRVARLVRLLRLGRRSGR